MVPETHNAEAAFGACLCFDIGDRAKEVGQNEEHQEVSPGDNISVISS